MKIFLGLKVKEQDSSVAYGAVLRELLNLFG